MDQIPESCAFAFLPQPASILVVDDMPVNLHVIGELLKGQHYRVRAAGCSEAALPMQDAARAMIPSNCMS